MKDIIYLKHRHNIHFIFPRQRRWVGCARCSGLIGGVLFGSIIIIFTIHQHNSFPLIRLPILLLLTFFLTVPLVIDWWMQCLGLWHSRNWIRFFTGFLTSFSGILTILNYNSLFITVPLGIIWGLLVLTLGLHFRSNRIPVSGCNACDIGSVDYSYETTNVTYSR